jgi:hypothetical protein
MKRARLLIVLDNVVELFDQSADALISAKLVVDRPLPLCGKYIARPPGKSASSLPGAVYSSTEI